MRTIGIFIAVLVLLPSIPLQQAMEKENINSDRPGTGFRFHIPVISWPVLTAAPKKAGIDTNDLKQSSWYADAIKNIQESEYEIKPAERANEFASPNRRQNLRAFYSADQFTLEPRADDNWKLQLTLKGIYSGKKKIYSPQEDAMAVIEENKIQFNHYNEFAVEYINNKEGIRQNFIIQKEPASKPACPAGRPQTLNIKLQTNKGWFINQVHAKEIHFAKIKGHTVERKLTYNDLNVWDANNKELDASFSVVKNEIIINVNTYNAVYPITIDPLSTTPASILEINQNTALMGNSVSSAGDVNGDGYSDVIVGAPYYDNGNTNEGGAFVFHGSTTGISTTIQTQLEGDQDNAQLGFSVCTAGDVNGDGYSDVIIGTPYGSYGQSFEGAAFVYHGSSTGITTTIQTQLECNQASASMGRSVAAAGDVNGDGYSDVIVGAMQYDNGSADEGAAFVYHGSASGITTTIQTQLECNQVNARYSGSVSSAGDVNGDGYSDVIVGAEYFDNGNANEGAAFVYHGSASGITTTIQTQLECNLDNAQLGLSVAAAGDVNGDGYSDVIAGAWNYNNGQSQEGAFFVYHGSGSGITTTVQSSLEGNQIGAEMGYSVASAGDVNGDGYSDIIVGAQSYDNGSTNEGVVFVFYGSASGINTSVFTQLECNQSFANFGHSVKSAGDVNGDGYSDIIVGAHVYDDGNTDEGAAFVYHGGPDGLSATFVNTPDDANQSSAYFGNCVASAGDVNADGYSDVIIGAYGYDDGPYTDEGVAFVYHGSATGLSAAPNSILDDADQSNVVFGISVASAGDVNGDGYGDVIVGASKYTDGANTEEGRAFVYYGSITGLSVTPNNTPDDADQAGAWFGVSVSSAGDINGDGYGDIVVGAWWFDDGANTNEGRAFVYYGSATGLSASPNRVLDDANQIGAQYGCSVASAGDVNGDGFGDVIVGAWNYDDAGNTDEGRAFVYHGSISGLSATPDNTPDDADQAVAYFGWSVASAGDVNGDGYGDVIIGAYEYDDGGNGNEGRAFVYHGSATGLSASPNSIPDDADQAGANFGLSVASAGDVNGDGYSDVIIGAYKYNDGGNTFEGRSFVYYGSSSGISSSPNNTPDDADQNLALSACSVASAGDVNGDGYSDVIIGSYNYTDGANASEGRAFLYYGNSNGGLRNNLRLYNSDLVTPIQQSNMSDPNLFGAGLYAKSFTGRQKGKLVWETVRNGNPFSGNPITNSTTYTSQQATYTNLGLTGVELKNQVAKMVPTKATYVRTRVKYDLVTAITGQVYGPWRYPEGFLRGRRDIGAVILPVKFISFTAIKQDNKVSLLKWITTEEEPGLQFEVQHSTDGINFSTLVTINGKNQLHNEYAWLHVNPSKGNNFYRIRAVENQKEAFTATRKLIFIKETGISVYPNPVVADGLLTISNMRMMANQPVMISLINSSGQIAWQKEIVLTGSGSVTLNMQGIPPGAYLLQVNAGKWEESKKIMVADR